MSRDSKSPSINFDTDSSDSDNEPDLPPAHTPSPLLAPTPTMAERLKRANEDLNSNPSPPNSRISRIGFREDMEDVLEFDDNESPHEQKKTPTRGISPLARETHITEQYPGEQIPTAESPTPKSPAAQKNSTPQPPPAKVSQEPEVEAPAKTASQPVTPSEEPEEIGTGGRFLTEVNGTFQMDFQVENVGEDELSEEESPIKSKRHDPIPEYKSPYGLTKEQKKLGRQRKLAQHRKLMAEEELKQVEQDDKHDEAEQSFNAWLKLKNEANKKQRKPKDDVNSSRMMKEELSEEERNEIWEEWKKQKAGENHRKRLLQHQQEIEKMEGLYVRSRQENNKAFRKWVKKKEKEERIQQEIHYRQVQAAKEELRTIKRNQKRNTLLDAARVASILDYY